MKTEDVLFVCTGNVCRSAMAEAFARRAGAGNRKVNFRSAGFVEEGLRVPKETLDAMSRRGLELEAHRSRLVEAVLQTPPDLVITMAREHLRQLVALNPELFAKTFTLKELVRRALRQEPRRQGEALITYLARVGKGRKAAELMGVGYHPEDDVADPIGKPLEFHETIAVEIETLIDALTRHIWK